MSKPPGTAFAFVVAISHLAQAFHGKLVFGNMAPISSVVFLCLSISLASALLLHRPQSLLPESVSSTNIETLHLMSDPATRDTSQAWSSASEDLYRGGRIPFYCDGDKFGGDVDVESCLGSAGAVQFIGTSPAELTFGMRRTGKFDINLPRRFISCKPTSNTLTYTCKNC